MKMLVWIRRFYECCTMLLDKKTVWRQFSEMEIYPKVFIKSKLGELIFNLDPYFDGKHFSSFLTFCICSFSGKTPLLHLQWSWNPLPLGRWGTILSVLSDLKFLPTPGSPQANGVLKYFTFWGHNRVFLYWGIGLMGERSPPPTGQKFTHPSPPGTVPPLPPKKIIIKIKIYIFLFLHQWFIPPPH